MSQNYLRDYNLISDQFSGLNAITVPGYLVQDEDLARLSPLLNPDDDLLG